MTQPAGDRNPLKAESGWPSVVVAGGHQTRVLLTRHLSKRGVSLNFHPDPMLLRRFSADLQAPFFYFAEEISGVRHLRPRRIEGIQQPGSWVQRVHRV